MKGKAKDDLEQHRTTLEQEKAKAEEAFAVKKKELKGVERAQIIYTGALAPLSSSTQALKVLW